MRSVEKLPDIFTSIEAARDGISHYQLSKFVEDGLLEKTDRGVYKKTSLNDLGDWTHFVTTSKKIKHKNALCLVSALVYHQLTEVVPSTIWLLVDFNIRTTKHGITLFRRRNPQWKIGITKDGPLLVTDLERTLVECLIFKEKVGYNEAYYALKKALDKKKPLTTLAKIIDRAKELGSDHQIMKQMEAFIYE